MSRRFNANSADFITLGNLAGAKFDKDVVWSVLAFFRCEDVNGADDNAILSKWAGGKTQFILRIDKGVAPENIEVFMNGVVRVAGGNNISDNTWYLVAVTNDGSAGLKGYLLDMSGTFLDDAVTGTAVDSADQTASVLIAKQSTTADPFDGDIAFACYVDKEISKTELTSYLRDPVRQAKIWKAAVGVQFFLPLGLDSPEPDWSGLGNDGTVFGSSIVSPMPPVTLFTPKWAATVPLIEVGGVDKFLAGTAAAVSSLAGALPVDKKLNATVAGVSSLTGMLPVEKKFSATIAAVSSLSGVLPVDRNLISTIAAASTLAGDLTIAGEKLLAGIIAAASTLSGQLPVDKPIAGTVAAASTLDAILGRYRAIAGSSDAVSTLAGDLQRLRGLAGQIAGGSTLAGALELQWALRGVIAGLSDLPGSIRIERQIAALVAASASLTGALTVTAVGVPWKRENLLTAKDISGPVLRAPHRKEIE